jgi:hypothetical protein
MEVGVDPWIPQARVKKVRNVVRLAQLWIRMVHRRDVAASQPPEPELASDVSFRQRTEGVRRGKCHVDYLFMQRQKQ